MGVFRAFDEIVANGTVRSKDFVFMVLVIRRENGEEFTKSHK